ncbi:unnamed protein product, partial [Acanthocheilonema viteae]
SNAFEIIYSAMGSFLRTGKVLLIDNDDGDDGSGDIGDDDNVDDGNDGNDHNDDDDDDVSGDGDKR